MCLKSGIFLWFISFSCSIAVLNAEFSLTIIHTNDMHSRMEEINARTGKCDKKKEEPCYGGFARVAHEAARIKSETKNTLFLNAGDTYQGTPLHTFFKYKMLVPLMKKLKIDVMSLGNHEFDDGIAGLAPYLKQVKIPVVACNIDTTKEPSLNEKTSLKKYHMLKVGKVKIAVIGYILPDTKFLSSTGDVEFMDEVKMIKKYALEAKKSHQAKLVFAVGHSGIEIDQKIAREVPEVDVVVGGHTDTFLYTGKKPDRETPYGPYPLNVTQPGEDGKVVPVVQAYGYTKYLGRLDLVWDNDYKLISATGNPILLDSSKGKDQEVEEEISKWTTNLTAQLEMKKGSTRVNLNGDCRFYECNVGNFITDAIANYVVKETDVKKGSKWTDAPIAILNSGSFRTSIPRTEIVTFGSILTMIPFTKQLVRLNMYGSILMKALHRSIERYDPERKLGRGEFLQMSGMKVRYVQLENGSLAVDRAYVLCGDCQVPKYSTLDVQKNYTVVTTSFVADGGDGFYMFKNETIREHTYKDDLTVVASYLELMSPIY
uniref:Uncharacterized protein n=1 Tax=Rhodnius prolixus TaxID=13249 RepID=T1HRT1_RHOPR